MSIVIGSELGTLVTGRLDMAAFKANLNEIQRH